MNDINPIALGILALIVLLVVWNWKRLSGFLDRETRLEAGRPVHNDEVERFVLKYRPYDSQTLIETLRLRDIEDDETKAIRIVLAERKVDFTTTSNV